MKRFHVRLLFIAVASLGATAPASTAQIAPSATYSANNEISTSRELALPSSSATARSSDAASPTPGKTQPALDLTYTRPTEGEKFHRYLFAAFGPNAVARAAISGALSQATNTPKEWGQGMGPYGERVGSAFGISMVTTTTRYALAEAFHEDTMYYRCDCTGTVRRLEHAVISTVTARVGDDGRRRLSFPSIVSPYAGAMIGVYGWYPDGYGAGFAFQKGSFSFLTTAGINVAREFIYGGPHTLFHRSSQSLAAEPSLAADSKP